MKFSIITPCRNAERYIIETATSVLNQSIVLNSKVELEYLICDGASSDATLSKIAALKSPAITVISETDSGMYQALAKGLAAASGDIVGYLNAGDYYHKEAFSVALDVFERPAVKWLTGINCTYNEKSQLVGFSLPYRYRRHLIQAGMYGTALPFIQQESTFWRRELHSALDLSVLAGLRYAGDYYLWRQFSAQAELYVVNAHLGGFRVHRGQISGDMSSYATEMATLANRAGHSDRLLAAVDRVLWNAPVRVKKMLNSKFLLQFDHQRQEFV